jgi:3' terminal RNA ribose 2'-O-methyltransferase Hen1
MPMYDCTEREGSEPRLHDERLEAIVGTLLAGEAETVLDLGCGPGDLLLRLANEPSVTRVVGVDLSIEALESAARRLRDSETLEPGRVELLHASFAEPDARLTGFDAAVLMETIEHIEPERLSTVERAVFGSDRPRQVLVSTPNREWNDLLGVPPGHFRHPDHRFEWSRARFAAWARGVAGRNGYRVAFQGIGAAHPLLGCPTQLAVFLRGGDGMGGRATAKLL